MSPLLTLLLAALTTPTLFQEPEPAPESTPTITTEGVQIAPTQEPEVEPAAEPEAESPAKETPKSGPRPADTVDWQQWERLGRSTLSPDGRWVAWQVNRNDGTQELRVRMLATDADKVYEQGGGPTFSPDSKWLFYSITPSEEERKKKDAKRKVGILNLLTGEESEIEGVSNTDLSEDGRFLAMTRNTAKGDEGGADLVLRDLVTGMDVHFGAVGGHAWCDTESLLAMTVDAPEKAGNGVRVYNANTGVLQTLDSDEEKYTSMTWREDATDLAVLRERSFEDDEDVTHVVLAWRSLGTQSRRGNKGPLAFEFDLHASENAPDMRVVSFGGLSWSDDGRALLFGIKEWEDRPEDLDADPDKDGEDEEDEKTEDAPEKPTDKKGSGKSKKDKPKETLRESLKESPGVEVWHADDIDILPRQKKTAARDARDNFQVALHLDDMRFVQLEDETVETVRVLEKQRWAIGFDETPYEEEQRFSATYEDLYRIDVKTGERTKILDRVKYAFTGDPDGRRVLVQRDGHLWSLDLKTMNSVNLTAAVDTAFVNQEMSQLTTEKPPYGVAGWTTDGRVLLNSRYDLWAFRLDGKGHTQLTRGAEDSIRHRRTVLDFEEEEFIDPAKRFHISLYGDLTKKSGYGTVGLDGQVKRLVYEDAHVGGLSKAEEADIFAYTRQRFDDSPDVFVGGTDLADARQYSATNAFQKEFLWGKSELVEYTNARGETMQGSLYYPAGWEEGKQYPMITYIYELMSQDLHRYAAPSETSPYNPAVFTSQGYFWFEPDITYRAQFPGVSASECVIPAVQSIVDRGLVDKEKIGLVGHSWGAYQTAFLVTQTDLFAAGVAGAPLTNMMSMSMSIYWNSGQTDAYIFHESQGRMDRPFWQDVETYIANSPIFHIDKMNTPLLVAFGDEDGAVDWHQGIEMYNAARLARKPMVMLVYAGENHSLAKKPNRVDYHHRVREWFDHYLNGADAPAWITEGQSYLDLQKEREEKKESGKAKR